MTSNKYSIRVLPIAEQDIQEIVLYVASENITAAYKLVDKIEENIERLSTHPFLGRTPTDQKLSTMGYRVIIVEDYLIFYTIRSRSILVHRIIHGARDLKGLL